MTIQQLSAQAVRVQLTAQELHRYVSKKPPAADAPGWLPLIAWLLRQAEAASGIPFSGNAVAVELIPDAHGGITVYFSLHRSTRQMPGSPGRSVRLAARFPDLRTLSACCRRLAEESAVIAGSRLYRCQGEYILMLRMLRTGAAMPHHLLLEYGAPFRLSAMNRARLSEHGECIYDRDAVQSVLAAEG